MLDFLKRITEISAVSIKWTFGQIGLLVRDTAAAVFAGLILLWLANTYFKDVIKGFSRTEFVELEFNGRVLTDEKKPISNASIGTGSYRMIDVCYSDQDGFFTLRVFLPDTATYIIVEVEKQGFTFKDDILWSVNSENARTIVLKNE